MNKTYLLTTVQAVKLVLQMKKFYQTTLVKDVKLLLKRKKLDNGYLQSLNMLTD